MKVGIMGGTFDPIHNGHLIGAETAREAMQLDEVWFLPANIPPHKDKALGASAQQRLEMVNLAVMGHPNFRVKDLELKKGGTSYTIDTVKALNKQYPHHHFYWVIGGDMVQFLPHWHQIGQLAGLISFIGLSRQGYSSETDNMEDHIKAAITIVSMPLIEISSTDIRERCSRRESVRYLVPEQVRQYMEENKLYES